MSHRHPIDELFHSRLAQYDAGAPLPLWDKIAARQKRRRQLRRFGWLMSSLALVALAGVAYELSQPSLPADIHAFPIRIEVDSAEAMPASVPAPHSSVSPTTHNRFGYSEATSDTPTHAVPATGFRSSDASTPDASSDLLPAPASISYVSSSIVQPPSAGAEPPVSVATPVVAALAPPMEPNTVAAYPMPVTLDGCIPKGADETTNDIPTGAVMLQQPDQENAPVGDPNTPAVDPNLYRLSGPHLRANARALAPLPQVQPASHLSKKPVWRPMSNPTACVSFQQRSWQWAWEGLAGVGIAQNGFIPRQEEAREYANKRQATETSQLAYMGQLRMVLASPSGLRFRIGLQYARLNSQFRYENPEVLEIHIMPIIGPNGEIVDADTTYSPYLHNTANHYQWLNMPILLGYETRYGKLRLGFLAGPSLNLRFDAEGEFISPQTNQPTFFGQMGETQVAQVYRQSTGISWYLAANGAYHLNGRYSLIAEAFVQRPHQSIATNTYVLRHQPWATGLQLGIRAKL